MLSLPGSQPESSKGKSPGSLCVDGLAVVVQLACNADEEGRRDLLFPIVSSGDVAPDSVSEVSLYLIRKLQVRDNMRKYNVFMSVVRTYVCI